MTPSLSTLKESQVLSLRCPYCTKDNSYSLPNLAGDYAFQCASCAKPFKAKVLEVRAKSGRQDKKMDMRELRLRGTYPDGREDHIMFQKAGIVDIEARSGDLIAISYQIKGGVAGLPVVINNYNIGRSWFLQAPRGCGCAAVVMLVVLAGSTTAYLVV